MINIKPPDYRFCPFCGKSMDTKIEEDRERKVCNLCHWTYYPVPGLTVGAIIVLNNQILLVKRNREPFKGKWMLPAGFVEFGEHPSETLKREIEEEVGLELVDYEINEILQSSDDPRAPGHLIIFYNVRIKGETKNLDKNENEAVSWFDIKNLPEIGFEPHKYIMSKIQKHYIKY